MFLIEALPSVALGCIVFAYLPDRIADATWLGIEDIEMLAAHIHIEDLDKQEMSLAGLIANPRLWQMALIYFSLVMGLYGVSFWLPTIVKATGVTDTLHIGFLTAIPYAAAALGMVLTGRSADRQRERRWHLVIPILVGSAGLLLSTLFHHNTPVAMVCLTCAMAGILAGLSAFWSLPTAFLGGTAAAAGIALINSLGNLAGFVSPYLVGWLKDLTHSTDSGMVMIAASMLIGALATLLVPAAMVNK